MPPAPVRTSLPDVSIRQLEYLSAVADAPTWAVAAESVGVSPSALSQGLTELERRIGVELFERRGRRRVVRAGARPAVDHARQVVALTRDLVEWSDRLRGARSGRVRVGMIDVAATVHFPDVLGRFRTEHDDVELTLVVAPSRTLIEALVAGELDLAVAVGAETTPAGVRADPLLDEPLVVYAPPGVSVGAPSEWGPWVLFPPGSYTRRRVDRALADAGVDVDVVAESHQPDVVREMVRLGLGWTALPPSQGDEALSVGPELLRRELVLARRDGAVTDPAVDELARRLVAAAIPST